MKRRRQFGLPLLAKELIEQSARRRTYIVRACYALLLLGCYWLMTLESRASVQRNPFAILGRGRPLFEFLITVQFLGIYVCMTAMTCGAITQEKERNSLGLLLLTRMGPWNILFEKLLARVVPMLVVLLISTPLLGFVYALGGVTQTYLWSGCWMLLVAVVQVGSIALACSCWFRTTVGAFFGTCIAGCLLFFTLPVLYEMRIFPQQLLVALFHAVFGSDVYDRVFPHHWAGTYGDSSLSGVFFVPLMFYNFSYDGSIASAMLRSIPALASAAAALLAARWCVVRRAFAPPTSRLLNLFRALDRFFQRVNQNRVTRGIEIIRDSSRLPDLEPVAWRETTKRSYGTTRYLLRLLLVVELPVVIVTLAIGIHGYQIEMEILSSMLFVLVGVAALFVSVAAASLISGERARQTLDVLLATPMWARHIVLQKLRGLRRLTVGLCLPPLTIILFQAWWRSNMGVSLETTIIYLVSWCLALAVYLPLVTWLSLAIGLRTKSQTRAIFGAILGIALLNVGCFVVPLVIYRLTGLRPAEFLVLSSPVCILVYNEYISYQGRNANQFLLLDSAAFTNLVNFTYYGTLLFAARWYALRSVDRALGREGKTIRMPAHVSVEPLLVNPHSPESVAAIPEDERRLLQPSGMNSKGQRS